MKSLRRSLSGDGQSPPSLLRLAKQGKFDEMIQLLNREDRQYFLDECAETANHQGDLNIFVGQSTLQMVMVYRPPVELVDLLIRRLAEHNPDHVPEDSMDMQGRTPLHVAVSHSCIEKVVRRLMGDSLPVIMKDQQDRTPLHCACANPKGLQRVGGSRWQSSPEDSENMYQVICALVQAYPEAIRIPDLTGKTPIVLALENKADHRILSALATAAARLKPVSSGATRPKLEHKHAFEQSFTIVSDCSSEIFLTYDDMNDVSSVGSGGVSEDGNRMKQMIRKKEKREKRSENFESQKFEI